MALGGVPKKCSREDSFSAVTCAFFPIPKVSLLNIILRVLQIRMPKTQEVWKFTDILTSDLSKKVAVEVERK